MSKIYEALLRAEMDRIAEMNRATDAEEEAGISSPEPTRNTVTAPAYTAAAVDQRHSMSSASSRSAVLTREPELEPLSVEPVAAEDDDTLTQDVQAFTPRLEDWSPDEQRLPSLLSRGILVEQIRVLRSRLHELRLDRPLKTVLISSGLPQEGKSFIAANLAVGFAKFKNRRVLLIDGDMRRGTQHQIFGAPHTPGLTDYLAGSATIEQVMQRMKLPDSGAFKSLASLTFIPSGADADNAADLSGNGRFEALLRAVYDSFDWIIVDSSPVTLVADGVNLARACDGVVIVARGGVTKYEIAQRAQQELKAAKVVGVVLNAVEGAPQVGGYYGYDS